jgi:rod shape-determining protein MreC
MLVLASITILTLDYHGEVSHAITHVRNAVRDVLSPMQRGVAAVLHPFGDVFAGAFHYGQLETENQQLRAELGTLRQRLASEGFNASQAADVLALEHLPYIAGIPMVTGQVIGNSTSNFQDTIEIDQGTSSGVGPGMPVVSTGGLVGTVSTASSSTATVVLSTDAGVSTPVRVGSSGLYRAAGQGRGRPLSLSYVGGSTAVRRHQVVYTSGLGGGGLPAGIPVGAVSVVRVSATGATTAIDVTPLVNFEQLQYVDVLEWLAPA